MAERLPASLELIFVGMLLGISTGLALGLLAAAFPRSWIDSLARIAATAGVAMPQFWFAMILQLVFGRVVKVLPIIGRLDMWIRYQPATNFLFVDSLITRNGELLKSALLHIILPAICVATYPTAMCTRLLRAKMLDIVNQEYIRTARAFGVSEKKIFTTYALKNALGPIIIMTALSFVFTLIGTFLVETIFAWPGIGSYAAESIISNDVPVIFSIVSITAICTLLLNLGAEIIIASLDPRIRFE
ncbi:MAG: ABC transporter permease [Candidatus Methanomethyliaceae archaeon]